MQFGQSTIDVVLNEGQQPAKLTTDSSGNTVLVGPDGAVVRALTDPEMPVLMLGGDHPYLQWYGTTGSNGMAQMYKDRGIKPYIAINTGNHNTYLEDPTDFMSWSQIAAMSNVADLIAHGHRHPQAWDLVNTGITVRYTGPAATATVTITSTTISGATAGAVEDFSFDMTTAPYDTLAEVVAAIDALPNWTCTMAGELAGTEASTNLLIRAATDAKTANLNLCAGGGIKITNEGTTYRRLSVGHAGGSAISIYADGVRVYYGTYSGKTLTDLVTAINALGNGITANLTNDTAAGDVNYCSGSESALCLTGGWSGSKPVPDDGLYVAAGLSHWYMVERQMKQCVDTAAANGVTFRHFAQSGGSFYANEPAGHSAFKLFRGNKKSGSSISPNAFLRQGNFIHHQATTYSGATPVYTAGGARLAALLAAIKDSPGYCVNLLTHQLVVDGTSGYSLPTSHPTNGDQIEADWVTFLDNVKTAQDAGQLVTLSQADYQRSVPVNLAALNNLLFNPKLKNSGESLRPAASDPGLIVPGWRLGAMSTTTSSVTIDADGFMTAVVTSGAPTPLQQVVSLPPGTYEFTAQVTSLAYTSGEGINLQVLGSSPDQFAFLSENPVPGQTSFLTCGALRGPGELKIRFSITPPRPSPAQVRGKTAQTYNLSTNKNIKININNIGATGDIDCSAGAAVNTAVTAKEVAAAINTAMAASSYSAEYHNIASAVAGKVVITNPYVGTDRTHNVSVLDGSTASAATAIFGGVCEAIPLHADNSMLSSLPITVGVSTNLVGTVKIGAFNLRKVGGAA